MTAMHWQFVLRPESITNRWMWRRMRIDGTIDSISSAQMDFGKIMHDAIKHGFEPKRDSWVLITGVGTTHFGRGQPPVSIPPDGEPIVSPANVVPLKRLNRRRALRMVAGKSPIGEQH